MTLFAAQMQGLIELNNDEEVTLGELYDELVERIDYLNFLKTDDPESAEDRAANVRSLASNLRRFEEENPEGTLSDFLEEVSLITDIDNYDNNADSVVLMTVHSAKGLDSRWCSCRAWRKTFSRAWRAYMYRPKWRRNAV